MSGLDQLLVLLAGSRRAAHVYGGRGLAAELPDPAGGRPAARGSERLEHHRPGAGGGGRRAGFRRELRLHPGPTCRIILLAGVAGSVGAALLLALPPGVFEAVVPWLILGTCVLVGV